MRGDKYFRFLRGPSVYFLGDALNQVMPLILLPVLTRYLDRADYGIVAVFMASVQMATALIAAARPTG